MLIQYLKIFLQTRGHTVLRYRLCTISLFKGSVPDHESRDHDVVLVKRTISLGKPRGVGKLERGRNGEGMGKGRSVYEQPGAKVDGIAPR